MNAFPERLLAQDEVLILDLRPHWIALTWAAVVALLEVVAAAWLLTHVRSWTWIVVLLLVVLLIAGPIRRLLWWLHTRFAVTTRRIVQRAGWISTRSIDIPLEAINDVEMRRSIVGRAIGAGTLVIRSASTAGRQEFRAIPDPEDVLRTIHRVRRENQQRIVRGTPESG